MTHTELNILLDAIDALNATVDGGAKPWTQYEGDTTDGPENEAAYKAAIQSARSHVSTNLTTTRTNK